MTAVRQLLHQFQMLVRPILVGLGLCLVWYFCIWGKFGYGPADQSVFVDTVVPVLAAFHAIGAGFVLHKVWTEYTHVRNCLSVHDKEGFIRIRNDRIPMPVHLLLGSIATIIQANLMLLEYENLYAGIAANFSVAFVLVLYFEVATNLDNPRKAVWYMGQIPNDWFTDPPADQKC